MVGHHDKIVMPSPIHLCGLSPYKHLVVMKTNPKCRVCGVELNDENWYPSYQKTNQRICKTCHNEELRQRWRVNPEKARMQDEQWRKANPEKMKAYRTRYRRKQGHQPFNENKRCSLFLGVYVAERVLSHVFKNVQRMPMNNPGYDLICGRGYKVDVKSSCKRKNRNGWLFCPDHNTIADYFLCLAFDNREDLNPLHVWLIPGEKINHRGSVGISPATLHKWDAYRLDISKIVACCNILSETWI